MATPQETEERLRTWTLGQAERERMCLGLLALDERFSNVRPRRPKGGPDGGRDIEAVLDGSLLVWGGVGFRNNAIDSTDDKTWVRDKFRADPDAALAERADLHGFVFFTNIDLTPGEVGDLEAYAKKAGIRFVEIFYRERLRIGLDSPKGLAYRYQYLRLPMSDAEQAAFFAQLGGRIEELLTGRFDQVDQQLARIEFLHECEKPVRHVAGVVTLDGGYTPNDLGHFRFLFVVTKVGAEDPAPTLFVGGRDAYLVAQVPEGPILAFGEHVLIWSQAPDEPIQDTRLGVQARQRVDRSIFKITQSRRIGLNDTVLVRVPLGFTLRGFPPRHKWQVLQHSRPPQPVPHAVAARAIVDCRALRLRLYESPDFVGNGYFCRE